MANKVIIERKNTNTYIQAQYADKFIDALISKAALIAEKHKVKIRIFFDSLILEGNEQDISKFKEELNIYFDRL